MKAGTKELKNRLSFYLRRVREGEAVYVSDRGRIVAEIRRCAGSQDPDELALLELAAQGLLTTATGRRARPGRVRLARPVRLSRAVIDDRT